MNRERLLFAFDLDGTTVGHDFTISPAVRIAIARAAAEGHALTFLTGRPPWTTTPVLDDLGLKCLYACHQGALVIDPANPRPLVDIRIDADTSRRLVERARTVPGATVIAYGQDRAYLAQPGEPLSPYYREPPSSAVALDAYAGEPLHKVVIIGSVPATLEGQLVALPGVGQGIRLGRSLELLPPGADKGAALAVIARHLDFPRERVVAFGDNDNDVSMLRWAGVGVAMGQAAQGVKSVANRTAPTVEEDGVATVIEALLGSLRTGAHHR